MIVGTFGVLLVGQSAAAPTAIPGISVFNVSTPEGPEGVNHIVSVPVTLSEAGSDVVLVDWQTVDGTAHDEVEPPFGSVDYHRGAGTVAFAPGETSKTIDVEVIGGDGPEADKQFSVELSNPRNSTITRGVATVTILNDDFPPPPAPGEVNVIPSGGGGQCVSLKGVPGCATLSAGEQIPIDAINYVDPRGSKVLVQSIVGAGTFYGGKFNMTELNSPGKSRSTSSAQAKPILVVKLQGGNFKNCGKGNRSLQAAAKKPVRRLWGKGKGRFRTRGRYSSGTVRGTNWLTEDFCNGTQTRVVSGIVQIYDLVLKKFILLHPGERYFAKPNKP